MAKEYIEKRGEGYYLVGSRVSLDVIVARFLEGASPESIVESFPTVTLEQVFGALAFYLSNRVAIDAYLAEGERIFEKMAKISRAKNPLLFRRLEQAKHKSRARSPKKAAWPKLQ